MKFARYVGLKAVKHDTVSDSGHVWNGAGDVRPVTDAQAAKLAVHLDIWEILDADPNAEQSAEQATGTDEDTGWAEEKADGAQYFIPQGEGQALDLSGLEPEQLHAFIEAHALNVDKRKKGDKLRAAIVAAYATKAAS